MEIFYTIWLEADTQPERLEYIFERVKALDMTGVCVVLPVLIDEERIAFVQAQMLGLDDWLRVLARLRKHKVPYILKFHLHPRKSPKGLKPFWWPNWLWFRTQRGKALANTVVKHLWSSLSAAARSITGYPPEMVILGAEFDAVAANQIDWTNVRREFQRKLFGTPIVYGTNFWQPLRWRFRWQILLLRLFGWDRRILRRILNWIRVPGLEVAEEHMAFATDQLYRSYLPKVFWKKFDFVGLRAYF